MVHVEAGDGESGHADSENESNDGNGLVLGVADDEKKDGLASEASAVEKLSNIGGCHDLLPAKVVSELASKRNDDGHDEVRQ